MKPSTPFTVVKTIQSHCDAVSSARSRAVEVVELGHAQHRRLDGLGPRRLQQLDQLRRLVPRPRHQHAAAEQRPLIEPAQVIAQADDLADHERGGAVERRLGQRRRQLAERADRGCPGWPACPARSARRCRPRDGRAPAARRSRGRRSAWPPRHTIVPSSSASVRPGHSRPLAVAGVVGAHERERVTAAGVSERECRHRRRRQGWSAHRGRPRRGCRARAGTALPRRRGRR